MGQKVFITGASSGLGEHLAYAYAKRNATLGLAARRDELLNKVANQCQKLGGNTFIYSLDVIDKDACRKTADRFLSDTGGIDIVIANAGVGGLDQLSGGDSTQVNRILTTNIMGVANTVIPFIPVMKETQSGTVVVISSVAGFRGMAAHGGYSGSKAAVRVMADGWRFSLSRSSIQVTTICPGFIDTPLVAKNKFPMPFLMDVDIAVEKIVRAINKGKKTYVFPWQWRLVVPILRIVPDWIIKVSSRP